MQTNEKVSFTGILIQDKDKGYTAYFAEFPEVIAEGDNEEEAAQNLFEAFRIMLEVKKQEMRQDSHFDVNSRIKSFELAVQL
jgi:predicted RNase H-like HicB family nuclease